MAVIEKVSSQWFSGGSGSRSDWLVGWGKVLSRAVQHMSVR
jgi:hypothetical protein